MVDEPQTWVSTKDAARYTGVGERRIQKACQDGDLPQRIDGRRRLVPLELVLLRLKPKDIEGFRQNLERAASMTDAPAVTREWFKALNDLVQPLLDELDKTKQRAALAEAQLDLLKAGRQPPPADKA